MLVIAILLLCLVVFGLLCGKIRHKMLKPLLFLGLVGIILLGVNSYFGNKDSEAQANIPAYQQIAPSIQIAPYVLPTLTRAYYIASFHYTTTNLILTDFYFYS